MHAVYLLSDPAPTEIYTLSLHDALPIYRLHGLLQWFTGLDSRVPGQLDMPELLGAGSAHHVEANEVAALRAAPPLGVDRKSTRLNSSHSQISYAVFCLKKKTLPCG